MKIGIFGGSYNPPHNMHKRIALELLNGYVDKIIFVPTGSKYKYKSNLISDRDRLNMLKIMTQDNEKLEVSDYELKDHVVYTCETLEYFSKLYPDDEIFFICGADNLSYIDEWKNGLDILEKYKILVIKRDGDDIDLILKRLDEYKDNIIVSDIKPYDVSSTEIRDLIINNNDTGDLIDRCVFNYIRENKLYGVKE